MNINKEEILNRLDDKRDASIKKLLTHNRNKLVFFSSGAYYMHIKKENRQKLLSGLLPALQKCFWPKFNYFSILSSLNKSKKKNSSSESKTNGSGGNYYGKIRGSIVHTQLHDFLFYNKEFFYKKHYNLHPWAKRILEEIVKKGWMPIVSEFDIFDKKVNIGTSVDMVCYCIKTAKIILIEIKTGYKNVFEKKHGYMAGCLKETMPLSFEHCATLQLLTSMLFIIKNHEIELDNIESHIIQINENEFNFYKISNSFILLNGKAIYNNLHKSYISSIKLKRKLKRDRTIDQIKKTPRK